MSTYNQHNIFIVQATDVDALFDDTRTQEIIFKSCLLGLENLLEEPLEHQIFYYLTIKAWGT
jgi:hypothetical protein